ncbi:Uncharacterised protein [Algoriella xinjiangensis]|uniref:hypothetical protein n=1 Tax=Algoriella xinjiangensis TaxID=684065 RepID=UPI000F63F112|nr:hypothetical protein [Algoriella xinjiangensis]VDH16735.1 Uncharacterised protein [Algoriella xinjiangensis]
MANLTKNTEATKAITENNFAFKKRTAGKVTINSQLVNLQEMSYEGKEYGYELFILNDFGFFFNYETDLQGCTTNNGDGDVNWIQREYFLTYLEIIQDFNINDNIKFEAGRVNVSKEVKSLILKIASEKYYKSEEV